MSFNLHADYVKAASPRPRPHEHVIADVARTESPPGRARRGAALVLAAAARRLDGETARRAIA
jgi:hypothetical protein